MIRLVSFTSCKTAVIIICCFIDLNTPQKIKEIKAAAPASLKFFASECDYDLAKEDDQKISWSIKEDHKHKV